MKTELLLESIQRTLDRWYLGDASADEIGERAIDLLAEAQDKIEELRDRIEELEKYWNEEATVV